MEPVRNDTTADRRTAVELAKRLLVDLIWRTAKIEVDGVTFPDTQEIFDGRAPEGMSVDDIVTVNNIKRAWGFLLGNIDYPVDWQYIREYNRIIGEGRVPDTGSVDLPLYGRIEPLKDIPAVGRYSDLLKVTVTW